MTQFLKQLTLLHVARTSSKRLLNKKQLFKEVVLERLNTQEGLTKNILFYVCSWFVIIVHDYVHAFSFKTK